MLVRSWLGVVSVRGLASCARRCARAGAACAGTDAGGANRLGVFEREQQVVYQLSTVLSGQGPTRGAAASRAAAVSLTRVQRACQTRVLHAAAATGRERCGRSVAARAFADFARVGIDIRVGIDAAVKSGNPATLTPYLARADSDKSAGTTQLLLVPRILVGKTACSNGRPTVTILQTSLVRRR